MEKISDIINTLESSGMYSFFCNKVFPILQYENYETEIKIKDVQIFSDPARLSFFIGFYSEIKNNNILIRMRDLIREKYSEEKRAYIIEENGKLIIGNKEFKCRCKIDNRNMQISDDLLLIAIEISFLDIQRKGLKAIFGNGHYESIKKKEEFTRFDIMDI